jgi:hypothetical protein
VIVRFDLERDVVLFIKGNDPGVVHECGTHPRLVDRFRCGTDVRAQQSIDPLLCAPFALTGQRRVIVDHRLEGLVDAVFAPRLRDHFQFGIGRVAPFGGVIIADRPHFVQVERESAFAANR